MQRRRQVLDYLTTGGYSRDLGKTAFAVLTLIFTWIAWT